MKKRLPTIPKEETYATLDLPKSGIAYMCHVGIRWGRLGGKPKGKGKRKFPGTSWSLFSSAICKRNCLRKDCPGPRRVRVIEE